MYSLFLYICSTCFGCYLRPSSGAQTAEYSYRCALWYVNPLEQDWLGHPHTFSTVKLTYIYVTKMYGNMNIKEETNSQIWDHVENNIKTSKKWTRFWGFGLDQTNCGYAFICELFWIGQYMFWFNKHWGIIWIAVTQYIFQEGSWSLETVSSLIG
jgi:hypothetical protein